jgi:hypothetical protein
MRPLGAPIGCLRQRGSGAHVLCLARMVGNQVCDDPFADPDAHPAGAAARSDDGERLAVGFPGKDGSNDVGFVRVFIKNESCRLQLGEHLFGEEPGDLFGSALELSADGDRVAIGAWRNQGASDAAWCAPGCPQGGQVRVFEWNGGGWMQLGADIDGNSDSYYSGSSVAFSSDGSRVAVGGWIQVRVFNYEGTGWTQAGRSLPGFVNHQSECVEVWLCHHQAPAAASPNMKSSPMPVPTRSRMLRPSTMQQPERAQRVAVAVGV